MTEPISPGVRDPLDRPDGASWTREPKDRRACRIQEGPGQGYIDTGWTHVFVVPAEGGTARQLTLRGVEPRRASLGAPDGSEIYFTSFREEDWDRPENWQEGDIYAVSPSRTGRDPAAHRPPRIGW